MPLRGTHYRNGQGFSSTWVNDSLGLPLFDESTPTFEIKKTRPNPSDALVIAKETLLRLHETRPEHKEIRQKYY